MFFSRRYLPKGIIKNYSIIIKGKYFHYQAIDSDIKRYEEIRKLTTLQGEDYTTECLLDYAYFKNHYRVIAIISSRQKELDADPKPIPEIKLFGSLKNSDNAIDASESLFVLTILQKIKETRLKFSQGSVTEL